MTMTIDDIRSRVLSFYPGLEAAARITRLGSGIINRTYLIEAGITRAVLQAVSPIFSPIIHENIRAVTEHLAHLGMSTPRLWLTRDARPCLDLGADGGVWRVMSHMPGFSFDAVASANQARAAGALLARFHRTLGSLRHEFRGMRPGVHDTGRHLAALGEALSRSGAHRLVATVGPLGDAILAAAAALPALPDTTLQICHGDPKFNNFLFAGPGAPAAEEALCLVDLDTVGPMALAHEMADAWRSWCNPHGEDSPDASFDIDVFSAALDGYRQGLGRALTGDERRAFLYGVEWLSLELGARFARDAVLESYFGWDPKRFASRGEHNLVRAQGQWSLHQALLASRAQRARLLGTSS